MLDDKMIQTLRKEFDRTMEKEQKKIKKSTLIIYFLFMTPFTAFVVYGVYQGNLDFLLIYLAISVVVTTFALLRAFYLRAEKPTYEVVYPMIVEALNKETDFSLSHTEDPDDRDYIGLNKRAGLFGQYIEASVKQSIKGKISKDNHFERLNLTFHTPASRVIFPVFRGVLIHLDKSIDQKFFMTKDKFSLYAKPYLDEPRLDAVFGYTRINLYSEYKKEPDKDVIEHYMKLMEEVSESKKTDKVTIVSTHTGIYLAYHAGNVHLAEIDKETVAGLYEDLKADLGYLQKMEKPAKQAQ